MAIHSHRRFFAVDSRKLPSCSSEPSRAVGLLALRAGVDFSRIVHLLRYKSATSISGLSLPSERNDRNRLGDNK